MEATKLVLSVFLLIFISCFFIPQRTFAEQEESAIKEGHSTNDINHGKRYFLGLKPANRKYEACVSCHNIMPTDTLNWNPSAMDIAMKYVDKDFASFQQAVMQPSGVKMTASHVNFDIADEDLKAVKVYLDSMAKSGPAPVKPCSCSTKATAPARSSLRRRPPFAR